MSSATTLFLEKFFFFADCARKHCGEGEIINNIYRWNGPYTRVLVPHKTERPVPSQQQQQQQQL